ncbi:hypothetical protein KEHDKFFH_02380 [Marinobacter maroccanus]|uniref:Morphogenetic protein n=1 Tax=Marinobacter maroccanus TaxID=2055143 RepID=A0A2S5ZFQ2_9GAMM|nr:hypothetical protein [Marinobacter maroccanus]PPI86186.1 hypothetical protein KEHDKFFH_02380 [Marinobacter maroccanus]
MSKEKPILFKDDMVRAILEGRKTQTRRVMKPQPRIESNGWFHWDGHRPNSEYGAFATSSPEKETINLFVGSACPYGQPGDRLWVRETHHVPGGYLEAELIEEIRNGVSSPESLGVTYRADAPSLKPCDGGWTPSIHMPRWASRITLEIIDVRVERLQDISGEDSASEGATGPIGSPRAYGVVTKQFARDQFMRLWESINGPDSWQVNPWVWVIEFERIDREGEHAIAVE